MNESGEPRLADRLAQIREDYLATHHFWQGENTHPAMRSRVERDADCHMDLVAEYAAELRAALDRAVAATHAMRDLWTMLRQANFVYRRHGRDGAAAEIRALLDTYAELERAGAVAPTEHRANADDPQPFERDHS